MKRLQWLQCKTINKLNMRINYRLIRKSCSLKKEEKPDLSQQLLVEHTPILTVCYIFTPQTSLLETSPNLERIYKMEDKNTP